MKTNPKISQNKKIGLALSGGGARGLAHVGILKILSENGITISHISGCSMGGLIGALFSIGMSIQEIESIVLKYTTLRELVKFVDRSPIRRGLIVGYRLRSFLSTLIPENMQISDTKIPITLNAVDLITSKEVALSDCSLLDAVMATTALPGLFAPVSIDQFQLIDGGTLNNLPVNHLLNKNSEVVIAVDVHPNTYSEIPWQFSQTKPNFPVHLPDFFLDYYRAQLIMVRELTDIYLDRFSPDILIQPDIPSDITMLLGFQRSKEIIKCGENAALRYLPQIIDLIK